MKDPYENLANAIVLSAAQDYRKALRIISGHPYHRDALHKKRSLLQFFHSDWFRILTNLDPELLIKRLDEEVEA